MVATCRLRAIAAAYDNDRNMVEKDIAFLNTKPDGADTSSRILARLLLTEGDQVAAQNEIAKVKRLTHQDELLRAKILDAIAGDIKTPLIERKALQEEIRAIRSKHSIVSEYEASV